MRVLLFFVILFVIAAGVIAIYYHAAFRAATLDAAKDTKDWLKKTWASVDNWATATNAKR